MVATVAVAAVGTRMRGGGGGVSAGAVVARKGRVRASSARSPSIDRPRRLRRCQGGGGGGCRKKALRTHPRTGGAIGGRGGRCRRHRRCRRRIRIRTAAHLHTSVRLGRRYPYAYRRSSVRTLVCRKGRRRSCRVRHHQPGIERAEYILLSSTFYKSPDRCLTSAGFRGFNIFFVLFYTIVRAPAPDVQQRQGQRDGRLHRDGTVVNDCHCTGRPPSPFAGEQRYCTTPLERIRAALVGRSPRLYRTGGGGGGGGCCGGGGDDTCTYCTTVTGTAVRHGHRAQHQS